MYIIAFVVVGPMMNGPCIMYIQPAKISYKAVQEAYIFKRASTAARGPHCSAAYQYRQSPRQSP